MKGIALEIVVILSIAIASLILILSLMGYFKGISNFIYCNFYFKIVKFFWREEITSVPEVCKGKSDKEVEIVELKESDPKVISRILLAHIISCWRGAEIKGLTKDHPCYEIRLIEKPTSSIREENVSEILIKEDKCKSIENVDFGCGEKDQILWRVGNREIFEQKTVFIRYSSKEEAVEVIA